jgi:TRAP transporter TAXI family solute receptor
VAEFGTPDAALLPRRAALKAGLAGLLLSALPGCTPADRPDRITVAGGEKGGFYLEFATVLAQSLQRHGVAAHAVPLVTSGSFENMELLRSGQATFAVALADAAVQQAAGQGPSPAPGAMAAVGKVYENYVHCLVRQDSGIKALPDLGGRTAAIGNARSGTALTARRIIAAAGFPAGGARMIRTSALGLNDGLAALRNGSMDALFWSGGVPTAAIAAANKEIGLRFIDLSAVIPALRRRFGTYYDRVLIPEKAYEDVPAVWTVGVANLLLCRDDLDGSTVEQTVELLVHHARELIPRSSLGVQFLSQETLINTADVPLHPAAAAAYRALHG